MRFTGVLLRSRKRREPSSRQSLTHSSTKSVRFGPRAAYICVTGVRSCWWTWGRFYIWTTYSPPWSTRGHLRRYLFKRVRKEPRERWLEIVRRNFFNALWRSLYSMFKQMLTIYKLLWEITNPRSLVELDLLHRTAIVLQIIMNRFRNRLFEQLDACTKVLFRVSDLLCLFGEATF